MTFKLTKSVLVDDDLKREGAWFTFETADGAFEVKIAAMTRERVQRLNDQAGTRNFRRNQGSMPEYNLTKFKPLFAREIIKDVRGLVDDNGKEIPYSVDIAVELMDKLPNFEAFITDIAFDLNNFIRKDAEDDLKNLSGGSSGI